MIYENSTIRKLFMDRPLNNKAANRMIARTEKVKRIRIGNDKGIVRERMNKALPFGSFD